MKEIDKVFWKWEKGTSYIEVTYSNLQVEKLYQPENPPTKPSHDIAHILCAFHGMNWNFKENKFIEIAEFNAVFMEHILMHYFDYLNKSVSIDYICESINSYLKYFCNEYYKISEKLGDYYTFEVLKKNFLEKLDTSILDKHYDNFYKVFYLDTVMNIPNLYFEHEATFHKKGGIYSEKRLIYFNKVKETLRGIS